MMLVCCQREPALPSATSAAKDVYQLYAQREDLTVAMIGDYQGYNAVMLQAPDAEEWLELCEEFGVGKHVDAAALDSTRVSSLTVGNVKSRTVKDLQSLKELLGDDSNILEHIQIDSLIRCNVDTAFSITHRMTLDHGVLVDSSVSYSSSCPNERMTLMQSTIKNGHHGYIVHDDSKSLTLWLFFYNTEDEKNQILNTISQ